MTHLQRSSEINKNRKKKIFISIVILLILVIGLFFRDVSAKFVHGALFPINRTFSVIVSPFSDISTYFSSKVDLQRENEELKNVVRMQEIELMLTKTIQDQNVELKQVLNLRETGITRRMVGQIVLAPPFSPFDTFLIRLENNDSIGDSEPNQRAQIGNHVFIKNILVGEVSEIYGNSAVVRLYSTYGEILPVRINNEIIAEAEGRGGLSFIIELPKDVEVEEDSPIYSITSPENIVGFIEAIETNENSTFQKIYFQYPFTFNNFNFVEIEY